jgi:hypothetical protein
MCPAAHISHSMRTEFRLQLEKISKGYVLFRLSSLYAVASVRILHLETAFQHFAGRCIRRKLHVVPLALALLCSSSNVAYAQTEVSVSHASGTLAFAPIASHAFGDPPFRISAASASPAPVTYTVLGGPATLSGDMLTLNGGGRVRLLAKQAASGAYAATTAHIAFAVSTATSRTMSFTQTGSAVKSAISSDTPNFLFIDSNGQFFLQNADSDYNQKPEDHVWDFYTGKDAHDPALKLAKEHSQFDTQAMCEAGSPVYRKLYSVPGVVPGPGAYADGNFCDAVGVWVDPDTGDWYAVVHNELYPSIPRIDVLSFAISKNHGRTWALQEPIATSPYGAANKNDFYYDYGEGDARLVADTASGYFYLFYNSRIMTPKGKGFSGHEWEHVSRAPIRRKMAPDSWEKYYNGSWSQTPGIDWTCDPAKSSPCPAGGPASALGSSIGADDEPAIHQTLVQPVSAQKANDLATYTSSALHTASISWNVALGKYIAFAEDRDLSQKSGDYDDPTNQMSFYVSDDLNAQKWTYAGGIPYKNSSWYRWMVDPGNLTSSKTIGSTFLAYCSVSCSNPGNDSEYVTIAVSLKPDAAAPSYFSGIGGITSPTGTYAIHHAIASSTTPISGGESWIVVPVPHDPGFFNVQHKGKYLGVADGDAGRAWGAAVRLSRPIPSSNSATEMSRQQWYFERIASKPDHYRLINRYSGLALSFTRDSLSAKKLADAVTVPIRDWDAVSQNSTPIRVWKAADQELILTTNNTNR